MAIIETDITICGHGSGNPSLKNLRDYCSMRYRQIASNGVHKGLVSVKRLKAMTDAKRKEFVDTYKTILGRNIYSQTYRTYVYTKRSDGRYYSDCSSSGMATMQKIGLKTDGLLSTAGIYRSSLFETVDVVIKNGHIQNPEVLKVGDCLLFAGNDPNRPLQIGHVEYVYEINGQKESAPEPTAISFMGTVTAYALNVRKAGSTGAKIITTVHKGDLVWATKVSGNWAYINNIGWASMSYIKKVAVITGRVKAYVLNVRSEGSTRGRILKTIKRNATVNITKLNSNATWGYDSKSGGWVSLKWIAM